MENISKETGIKVTGKVVERESKNPKMPTGDIEVLAEEIRLTVIGSSSSDENTIAKVCQKVLNDSVDVVIKNNNFDNALDRYYMMGI